VGEARGEDLAAGDEAIASFDSTGDTWDLLLLAILTDFGRWTSREIETEHSGGGGGQLCERSDEPNLSRPEVRMGDLSKREYRSLGVERGDILSEKWRGIAAVDEEKVTDAS
jgi:hypothetical protein